jgi:hypothetical protein
LNAIDHSTNPFLDNIKSPIHGTPEELSAMENGFAKHSKYQVHGTIAAGDGIVFRIIMPANEKVEGDVTAYFILYSQGILCIWLKCRVLHQGNVVHLVL